VPHVITFRSARFDITSETPNPINPIAGESLLRWLGEQLRESRYSATTPQPEDWGWFIGVEADGASYLVGASGETDDGTPGQVDWTIQIHKHRSLKQKLTGANKLTPDDGLSAAVERLVRQGAGASGVEVARES
jgi:hypothetical protein